MMVAQIADGLAWLFVGALIGFAYFISLARGVAAICFGANRPKLASLLLLRIALAGGGFALVATQGAGPLLLTLGGLLISRSVVLRQVGGA